MALSEREQQVLRDLEEQLSQDDPSLVTHLDQAQRRLDRPRAFSPRHVGAGVVLVLAGLVVLVAGVAVGHGVVSIVVGVAGFAMAVWGVSLMLTRVDRRGAGTARRGSSKRSSSFMDRQADRWERRRESGR